jgi:hypothetical protein
MGGGSKVGARLREERLTLKFSIIVTTVLAFALSYYAFGVAFAFVVTFTLLPYLWVENMILSTLPLAIFCLALALLGVWLAGRVGRRIVILVNVVIAFAFWLIIWSDQLVIEGVFRLAATSSVLSMLIASFLGVALSSTSK